MNLRPAWTKEQYYILFLFWGWGGSWVWWHMPLMPWEMQTGELEAQDLEEASPGCIKSSRPAWAT